MSRFLKLTAVLLALGTTVTVVGCGKSDDKKDKMGDGKMGDGKMGDKMGDGKMGKQ